MRTPLENGLKMNRCYVVGSGASLKETPMDKIAGEPSVACNRIARIYPHTEWRPTHFVVVTVQARLVHWLIDMLTTVRLGIDSYVWDNCRFLITPRKNVTYMECHETGVSPANPHDDWWHDDITYAVTHAYGSGTAMMQIAAGLGYKEIVLLGMDANWKLGEQGDDPNHFDSDYGTGSGFDREGKINMWNQCAKVGHDWIRRMTDDRGIAVYNASPGSGITSYPRVRLEDIL